MICFDANVLIEIVLGRANTDDCIKYIAESKEDLALTMLSVDLIVYYAERNKLSLKQIENYLKQFIWLPLEATDGEKAFAIFNDDDYEDALQISCALRESCSRFATLDKNLAKKYSKMITIDLLS